MSEAESPRQSLEENDLSIPRESAFGAMLWWGISAGPVAWALDLGLSYALDQHACSTGHHYVLHVITVVCALIALSGLLAAMSGWRKIPEDSDLHHGRRRDRAYFQALLGTILSIAFFVVVIAGAVPKWVLPPCS